MEKKRGKLLFRRPNKKKKTAARRLAEVIFGFEVAEKREDKNI